MNPPPAFDMAVLSSNPNQFTISKYAGLIAIGSTIISSYTIATAVANTYANVNLLYLRIHK